MNATRGAARLAWPITPSVYSARALRLLLVVAGLFCVVRLGAWITVGLATLTGQSAISANTFGTRSLVAPSNLTGSPQGHDVNLSWSAGQNGSGYAVSGMANGTSNNCSGAIFAALGALTATPYADAGRYTPQGTWFCYQVATTASTWSSQQNNPVSAVQLGFVASSVAVINAGDISTCGAEQTGVAGNLDCGDQVVIGFNQPVNVSTGPAASDSVCTDSIGQTIRLGSLITTGACSAAETVSAGVLSGSAVSGCDCRFNARYAWDTGSQTLTVTIGTRTGGAVYPSLGGSPWTFKPTTDTTRLHSITGDFHVCDTNTGTNNCWPGTP